MICILQIKKLSNGSKKMLNDEQKKRLDNWFEYVKNDIPDGEAKEYLFKKFDKTYWTVYNLNPHETFDLNVDRYLTGKMFDKVGEDLK